MRTSTLASATVFAALAIACGQAEAPPQVAAGPSASETATSARLVHGDRDLDRLGYYADPNVYLTDDQIGEVAGITTRPVRVPTWLPEWTRDVEASVIVTNQTYDIQWAVEARGHDGLRGKFPDEMLTILDIFNGSWELSTPAPLSSQWDIESPVRRYRYHPDNLDLHGQPAIGPDCVPNEALLSWDTPDRAYLFGVTLGPNPECSQGVYDVEEMVRVADSMVPLSDLDNGRVLLPEELRNLFKQATSDPSTSTMDAETTTNRTE